MWWMFIRGKAQVQRSYANLLLYVALFPQLIAGPIVRYTDIAAQLEKPRNDLAGLFQRHYTLCDGARQEGAARQYCGSGCNEPDRRGFVESSVLGAWLGIFAYTFQIYFDFSGYSDMAIGLGHMFGFTYVENF